MEFRPLLLLTIPVIATASAAHETEMSPCDSLNDLRSLYIDKVIIDSSPSDVANQICIRGYKVLLSNTCKTDSDDCHEKIRTAMDDERILILKTKTDSTSLAALKLLVATKKEERFRSCKAPRDFKCHCDVKPAMSGRSSYR